MAFADAYNSLIPINNAGGRRVGRVNLFTGNTDEEDNAGIKLAAVSPVDVKKVTPADPAVAIGPDRGFDELYAESARLGALAASSPGGVYNNTVTGEHSQVINKFTPSAQFANKDGSTNIAKLYSKFLDSPSNADQLPSMINMVKGLTGAARGNNTVSVGGSIYNSADPNAITKAYLTMVNPGNAGARQRAAEWLAGQRIGAAT